MSKKHTILLLLMLLITAGHAQTIVTYAGTGTQGYSGDNGPATAAEIARLAGIAVDTAGNLYIPDYDNNRVRKVSTAGIITTFAGTGASAYGGDGGPATDADIYNAWNIVADKRGNIYFVEHGNDVVRKVNAAGVISTIAGNTLLGYTGDGGAATNATLLYPASITVDDTGNVYIGDGNNVIRKIDTSGIITTIAGTGVAGYNGDGIPATDAQINNPVSIMWGKDKCLYIGDNLNYRVRRISSSGIITTVAGNGTATSSGDGGPATAAAINGITGLATDTAGNIYISDYYTNVIRKITGTTISTIAGNGTLGFSGDGGNPLMASLNHPWGLAVDRKNNIFIADGDNDRVRRVHTHTAGIGTVSGKAEILNVYPNPSNSLLIVTSSVPIGSLVITNMLGETVYHQSPDTRETVVNIARFPAGRYIISTGTSVREFIKQ